MLVRVARQVGGHQCGFKLRFEKSSCISFYQTVAVPSVTKYALILRNVTTHACRHIQMLVSSSSRDCVCQLVANIMYLQFPLEISFKTNKKMLWRTVFFSDWPLVFSFLAARVQCSYLTFGEKTNPSPLYLSLIHIWRCRRSTLCRSRWSPYH